jgi:hypothetical protein
MSTFQSPKKNRRDTPSILCCSTKILREDQVDLCPRSWWSVCWNNETVFDPEEEAQGPILQSSISAVNFSNEFA